ncbi:MAG TPA: hypothetical protein VFA68_20645 [Terriglobales bacterium]|nr:hypothetical protein [Terriglobales bacterium]
MAQAVQQLQEQVKELRSAVAEMRAESAQYRAETAELRHQLETYRSASQNQLASGNTTESPLQSQAGATNGAIEQRLASLEDTTQLLNSKVDDQYQTKVASASRYRVRLSGIALLNAFSNRGVTDNQDIPSWANPPSPFSPSGNFGATLRQSEIGLEVFGPQVAGAKTYANIQLDFAGGQPSIGNGATFGLARLRIASMHLDWAHDSIIAGQDNLFISPLAPTSFASLAVPALSYAGNLWGWIPEVVLEHRFDISEGQRITVQGGIIDNLTGEMPYHQYLRYPSAGESSSQPAFGTRVAWTRNVFGQPLTVGAAGYYSRQSYGFARHVDGWAGMTDLDMPLGSRLALTAEFYRSRGAGALGAGVGRSVLFSGNPILPTTDIQALNSIGGWAQLKVRAASKLEFNAATGVDNPFANDVRMYASSQNYYGSIVRNRAALVNFVYRPKSNLLFSTEYRHLQTYAIDSGHWNAEQVNLMMGVLF